MLSLSHSSGRTAPGYPIAVDTANPLARGLISAYLMSMGEYNVDNDGSGYGRKNGCRSSAIAGKPYTLHGYFLNGSSEAPLVYTNAGPALNFNGTTNTVAASSSHPKSYTTPVTIITRVFLRNTTSPQVIAGNFNGALSPVYLYGLGLFINAGTLYGVGANNNSRVISTTAPPTGEWVTLALVTNTIDGKLFVNKQLVASGNLSGAASSYLFSLGCSGQTAYNNIAPSTLDGMVGTTLVFGRALSDAEIYSLTTNPYQILQTKRTYLLNTIAGLSSVSNDVVLTYNILNKAQADNSISWNILNSISKDGSVLWNLQNSVTADKSGSWNLLSQAISDKGLSWGILSTAVKDGTISWDTRSSVTTNANISWNILSSAFVDNPIRYDILTNVGSNQSTSWNISQFVYADKTVNWNIQSTMLTAFADIALRYDIVTKVYQDFNIYWGLLQQASSDKALNFNVLSSILSDKAIAWGIAEAVVNDLTVTANLLQNTGQELTLTWESAGIVSGDLVIKYNISSDTITLPAIKRMITVSAQDTKLKVLKDSRIISI